MIRGVLLALLTAVAACGGSAPTAPAAHDHGAHAVWTCPMHPQVRQDTPGRCPMCGMDLVAVSVGEASDPAVTVDPRIVQTTGIQTFRVRPVTLYRHLRALGEVVAAEDRQAVVTPRVEGWVTRLAVDRTGMAVAAGDVIATLYAPALVEAQQERVLADPARAARVDARLGRLGMDARDIATLRRTGVVTDDVPLRAPRSGTVLALGVSQGSRVVPGTEIARLADLSVVWVEVDVPEADAPWVRAGQTASLDVAGRVGPPVEATVDFLYPTVDPRRRTLRVRLVVDNAAGALRPGQLVTARLGFREKADVLAVPRQAVLSSGEGSLVFVHEGDGRFAPRAVTVGLQGDRRMVEIPSGLSAGEEVVANGLFLLDAESQLQEALRSLAPEGADAPEAWACPMHPDQRSDAPGRCGVCGMDLEPEAPSASDEAEAP